MKPRGSAFLLVLALLAGIAVGYCLAPAGNGVPAESEAEARRGQKRPPADAGESASVRVLRSRIAELERQLAAAKSVRHDAMASAETNAVAAVQQSGPGPWRGDPRKWMEDLKKNDPERFAQMTNRFARFRLRRLERQQRNLDFLASVDTSRMSASAKKTHGKLQDAIAARAELEEKIHQEGITDDERRALMEHLRESDRQLRELRRAERRNLFEATANTLGFDGEDANEIVATLQEVVEATDSPSRHMGPPPGGGGPR